MTGIKLVKSLTDHDDIEETRPRLFHHTSQIDWVAIWGGD